MRLGRIGFDRVVGYLAGAPASFDDAPQATATRTRIDPPDVAAHGDALWLDVRTPTEWRSGHLAGAVHIPVAEFRRRLNEVPRDRAIVVACHGGYRSSAVASLLERAGYTDVTDLRGGYSALPPGITVTD
jgi:rhodanese-related sulfurtransferase